MATNAENIATIKANLLTALATESASPKPSYSVDGQSVDWNGYRASLLAQIASLNALLSTEAGPFEDVTVYEA